MSRPRIEHSYRDRHWTVDREIEASRYGAELLKLLEFKPEQIQTYYQKQLGVTWAKFADALRYLKSRGAIGTKRDENNRVLLFPSRLVQNWQKRA